MTKREIIKKLIEKLKGLPKPILLNLLDTWEGRTPKLWCEPNYDDCIICRFPEDRICDDKSCEDRMIEVSK